MPPELPIGASPEAQESTKSESQSSQHAMAAESGIEDGQRHQAGGHVGVAEHVLAAERNMSSLESLLRHDCH